MKTVVIAALAAASLMAGSVAYASPADKANAAGCMKCHDVEKKKMASSFKDISAKNKGNAGYVDAAVKKISTGAGHPKATASEADLKEIMVWIVAM
jgi:cytochrome c